MIVAGDHDLQSPPLSGALSQLMHLASVDKPGYSEAVHSCIANWLKNHVPASELSSMVGEGLTKIERDPTAFGYLAKANMACISSSQRQSSATTESPSTPTTAAPTISMQTIEADILAKVDGCWSTGGGNVDGAYKQAYFAEGGTSASVVGGTNTGYGGPNGCYLDPNNDNSAASTVTVQQFHSAGAARNGLKMAKSLSSGSGQGFLATYLSGPVAVMVLQSATPEMAQAVASVPGLQKIS